MAKGHRSQIKRERNENQKDTRPSAKLSYARVSVQKACYVLDAIRGKDVETAIGILTYNPRYASSIILKLLQSAVANAENNNGMNPADLYIEECFANKGPTMKRIRPRAQGRAYRIEKRIAFADLENFYDENRLMRVKLDPALNATQNAQKYYKEYRKAKTAQQVLGEQIAQAEQELLYVDSVFDCLSRAQSESELNEIRQELREEDYMKAVRDKRKPPAPLAPLEFVSSEGFRILVGRNNRQNDKLTLKQANNNDIWLHTKNIPGSHTIIVTGGRQPGDATLKEAAMLAAYHSRAKDSSQVPVDYTQVRYVSKPQGAKPGMVIYVHYQTLFVTPQHELTEKLQKL